MKKISPFRSAILGTFLVLVLVINFFPTFGRSHFRYTGSDPGIEVWRIGWPFAMAQYDVRGSVHVGPIAIVVWPFELGVMGIFAFGWSLNWWSTRRAERAATGG